MTIIYSEERNSWNLFDGAEWIFEGTYEQCEKMMYFEFYEEEEYEEDCDYGD